MTLRPIPSRLALVDADDAFNGNTSNAGEALANLIGEIDAIEMHLTNEFLDDWYHLLQQRAACADHWGQRQDEQPDAASHIPAASVRLEAEEPFSYRLWIEAIRAGRTCQRI